MPTNPKYHKNYTEFGEPYQLVLPLNLEALVPEDDSVRLLSHELEGLDYRLLYQAYSAKVRNPSVDPKTMFKILYTDSCRQRIYRGNRYFSGSERCVDTCSVINRYGEKPGVPVSEYHCGFRI